MSSVINKLPIERQYAFKKHPQGREIKGADLKLVKPWNNDHNSYCELCNKGGNLLLCDYCNLSFHPTCLVPPLLSIPEGNWACPECSVEFDKARRKRQEKMDSVKQKSVSGTSTLPAASHSKSKSSIFEKEPPRPTPRPSSRQEPSTSRSDYPTTTHNPSIPSSASSQASERDRFSVSTPSERSRGMPSSSSDRSRYSSSYRDERDRSSHPADRRRSPSPLRFSRHSRSPSPRRHSARDSSQRRDSRSPPRQPSEPVRFGRVEKIRPEESQSYPMKRPYGSRFDDGAKRPEVMGGNAMNGEQGKKSGVVCDRWLHGECRFGSHCRFLHSYPGTTPSSNTGDYQTVKSNYGGYGGYSGYDAQSMNYGGYGGYGSSYGYSQPASGYSQSQGDFGQSPTGFYPSQAGYSGPPQQGFSEAPSGSPSGYGQVPTYGETRQEFSQAPQTRFAPPSGMPSATPSATPSAPSGFAPSGFAPSAPPSSFAPSGFAPRREYSQYAGGSGYAYEGYDQPPAYGYGGYATAAASGAQPAEAERTPAVQPPAPAKEEGKEEISSAFMQELMRLLMYVSLLNKHATSPPPPSTRR